MRKSFLLIIFLFPFLISCSNKKSKEIETDTVVESIEEQVIEEEPQFKTFYLTTDSLGPVKIGMRIKEIPENHQGLYDNISVDSLSSPLTVSFYLDNDIQFSGYDFGEGTIDLIILDSPAIKIMTPKGEFGIGDSFKEIVNAGNFEPEWGDTEHHGVWYWNFNGIRISPAQEKLSREFSQKLFNEHVTPSKNDIDDSAVIGFIGTGMPF